MRTRRYSLRGFIPRLAMAGAMALTTLVAAALAASPGPRPVIEQLNATLLEVMQGADRLGYAGRYQQLEPVLRQSFNFPFMLRIVVGRAWPDLSAQEQARLTEVFSEMSIATFAARFDGCSDESFEIVAEGPAPRDGALIETRIVRAAGEPVRLNYVMQPFDERWRIIDVLSDAKCSELARQRAEFAAILEKGGAQGLIATLEQKIDVLSDGR
jgi:phospholipid transport system substrate-binding protein